MKILTGILGVLLLAACGGGDGDGDRGGGDRGQLGMILDLQSAVRAGYDIDEVAVILEHRASGDVVEEKLRITGNRAWGEFDLKPGRWDVEVELYEDDELAGTGRTSAVVVKGKLTEVDLEIDLATGGVLLKVSWTDEPPVVADVSRRPVYVEISGVGEFEVHGLSRLGWDIEVIETPTLEGRTHKDAGLVTYPDVVMVGLASDQAGAEALATWIEQDDPDARAVSVILRGLGGEEARVNLFDVLPIDGDADIVSDGDSHSVGGVVLRFESVELAEWSVPFSDYPRCAWPGQEAEIEGVAAGICYPESVLHVPAPGTSDPLYLPAVRDGQTMFDWAEAFREDVEENGCVGCFTSVRRAISIIDRDGDGQEVGRVNIFEVWVPSFSFFDPEARYGYEYLFHVHTVNDFVEQA